ncbi:Gag [African green monkey simian foamy virus]|uniref:Gag polyprotein n=1 Tax=Simian foamy virus type 3 (strain LK3) TaxID=11644 RepID=GAG_SFV3L|nr:Gag [African green monkey simian foamy virus]P27400.1 RecName: Full=Gag polyprotein; AltName: Full=Pr71Gag; Contains: RecName: Full=Gag protein; AltName: Full=p68; Contains: RecName: Full=p3 [Simian foamy virus (TYPE 3 / STRAIN LK3)]pir/FOLJLK/ gag polyprotein - simian foamy virus (type 3, strain LK3) [Simian foamy virus]
MGDHNLNVQELLNLFQNLGIPRQPNHREVIGLRMLGGWWGPGTRYILVSIFLQDDSGQPLQQPRWRPEGRPVNPLVHNTIEAPWGELRQAFEDLDVAEGTLRFGPLANGNWIPGDEYSMEFQPPLAQEIAQMQRDELEEILDITGQICAQVIDLVDMQDAQIRGLERRIQDRLGLRDNLPVAGIQAPPSSPIGQPIASSSLQPIPGSSSSPADLDGIWTPRQIDPRLSRVAYNPFLPGSSDGSGGSIPVQPSAPPAVLPSLPSLPAPVSQPIIQYVAQPPVPAPQAIPIQHIRAVTGNTPTNPRDIPMWLGRHSAAIEGVFPMTTPDLRCRVVNALIGGSLGLSLEPIHCVNWAAVVAALYVRTHGSYPIHELANVLRAVVTQEGVATGFQLGIMLSNQDYNLVWGILRPLLPGQAVVTAMQQRLDQEVNDAARITSFNGHLNDIYQLLGLNARGQSIARAQSASTSGNSASAGRGRRGQRTQQQAGRQQQQQTRRTNQGNQGQRDNNQRQSSGGNQGQRGQGGYDLRPRTYQPQRYGGGRGRRWNDNQQQQQAQPGRSSDQPRSQSQQPQPEARGDQSRTSGAGRGQQGRGNQNRNQRRADANNTRNVDTVTATTTSSSTASSGQNGSSTTPPASGSRNQGD